MYTSGLDQVVLCPNRKPLLGPRPPAMVLAEDDPAIEQEVVLFYDFSRVGHLSGTISKIQKHLSFAERLNHRATKYFITFISFYKHT